MSDVTDSSIVVVVAVVVGLVLVCSLVALLLDARCETHNFLAQAQLWRKVNHNCSK